MLVKAVTLFLIAMLLLGMFGKLHLVGLGRKRRRKLQSKCSNCGAPKIGKGPCLCQTKNGT